MKPIRTEIYYWMIQRLIQAWELECNVLLIGKLHAMHVRTVLVKNGRANIEHWETKRK